VAALDQRIHADRQIETGRHPQQGTIVTDTEQDIRARRGRGTEIVLDELKFGQ
jgi:hypothetical protein